MSEQSLEILRRMHVRLRRTARRMTWSEVLFGCALTGGTLSALWLLSTSLEAGLYLDTSLRTVLFWVALVAAVGLTVGTLAAPLLRVAGIVRGPSLQTMARTVGRVVPQIGDRLVNLLDLSEGRHSKAPDELVDQAVRMLGREIEPVSFEHVADFSKAKRTARIAAIPVGLLLSFLVAAPGTFIQASARILAPGVHVDRPAPFQLHVRPGSVEIARGEALTVEIRASGREYPEAIQLATNDVGEDHVDLVRLTPDSTGAFQHTLTNVRRSFRYRAKAKPVVSAWYEVAVVEYPLVRNVQVILHPPAYSRLPMQRLEPGAGDVTGLPGTRAELDLTLGGSEITLGSILFDDGSTIPIEIDGNRGSGRFTLSREGSYRLVLESDRGLRNRDPIEYAIRLVEDASPSIAWVYPGPDAVLSERLEPVLETHVRDDFGFHDMHLLYRLAESRFSDTSETFEAIEIPIDDPEQLEQHVTYPWSIGESTSLDPVPGDVIEYFVRVRDNDAFAGFKASETPVQRFRLSSLAEHYESLHREQETTEAWIEGMLEEAESLDEQFRELRDELRRKQEADWEDQRQIDQIEQRQDRLEQQVDQLAEQVETMNRSADRNQLLSEETMETYRQMQQVIEEIDSPELRDALQQLRDALENMDLAQMQEAIEDFEFNEARYRERLERTLDLFKHIRAQQILEEAARRAEELARQQEEMAEKTAELAKREEEADPDAHLAPTENDEESEESAEGGSDGEPPPNQDQPEGSSPTDSERLARQQEISSEAMKQLEELMREAQERIEAMKNGPERDMRNLNESVRQWNIPQEMMQNANQLRSGQLQDAQSGQQQMMQQLRQMQSRLSGMQQGMQGMQAEMNRASLRMILAQVLTLSRNQESLRKLVEAHVSDAPSLREDLRRQAELSEGLATVIDSLRSLGKTLPALSREAQRLSGQSLREMDRAMDAMTDRAVGEAAGYQTASMMNLNELALLLSGLLDRMMQPSGQGGMQQLIQQMQQMAQQQMQLNQQMQQLLNDLHGNRIGANMEQRLQQMAAQQQSIKEQLDALKRNPEARGTLLGDLDKIAEEMEETIRDLRERQVEPEMIERQQRILQRLLDAQRSMNQREREQRREAHEAEDVLRESPPDPPAEETIEKLRRDLIRALESGYAPDFERLIQQYFELLQQQTRQAR